MSSNRRTTTRRRRSEHGAAAILAMMFLVIFASLATAMAIVSQGNLRTADSHMKINRALSAAETGVQFLTYRIDHITPTVKITQGVIDHDLAGDLWDEVSDALIDDLAGDYDFLDAPFFGAEPYMDGNRLIIPAMPIAPGSSATFEATMEPHPLADEDYDSAFYQRPPYSTMTPAVSNAAPLDGTWVRVRVVGADRPVALKASGEELPRIFRTITMDFKMDKKIRFAILSKSRIMVGRNVMIEGTIGSRFMDTHLVNGHPVQIESDFGGINSSLDDALEALRGTLATNDQDGDNRLHVYNELEVEGIADPVALDLNEDGYIDDYDFFLDVFDADADGSVTQFELEDGVAEAITAEQLMELIDTFGKPTRGGYGDGVINDLDRYAKIRGEIRVSAALDDWENGAVNLGGEDAYQEFLQGPIVADHNEDPLTFEATDDDVYDYDAEDFETESFADIGSNDLFTQADSSAIGSRPPNVIEQMPFEAPSPYDYYERPVFKDMIFTDTRIPQGTNALFINCTFIGCTYIEADVNNFVPAPPDHDNPGINIFHYTGMWSDASGTAKHPDLDAHFQTVYPGLTDSKQMGNNIRFDNCTFEGAIVTSSPMQFSHTRNKLTFTGTTRFIIDGSSHLSEDEKKLYKRSTLMAPNFSIEMGTFIAPNDATETVELSGTIVAGVLDMRGQVKINGTILTTFEPKAGEGPVLGDTSPNFNTTLGYFMKSAGDQEMVDSLPSNGLGVIQVRYDPTLPMPDGILGPIELKPEYATYFEGESH